MYPSRVEDQGQRSKVKVHLGSLQVKDIFFGDVERMCTQVYVQSCALSQAWILYTCILHAQKSMVVYFLKTSL